MHGAAQVVVRLLRVAAQPQVRVEEGRRLRHLKDRGKTKRTMPSTLRPERGTSHQRVFAAGELLARHLDEDDGVEQRQEVILGLLLAGRHVLVERVLVRAGRQADVAVQHADTHVV